MRVLLEHQEGDIHISVFHMNGKYLLKFERGIMEQTYKLSEMDFLLRSEQEALQAALNLLPGVKRMFAEMQQEAIQALEKYRL